MIISRWRSNGYLSFASQLDKAKAESSHSDFDGMGSIPAIPNARKVALLLCPGRFDKASLPDQLNGNFWLIST